MSVSEPDILVNMEEDIQRLVEKAWSKYEQLPEAKRLLIGVAGIPGSGKTSFTDAVTARLQVRAEQQQGHNQIVAQCLSMDGFHFTRKELSAMPDPENAHARRGAAFTFDADKYLDLIIALRNPPGPTIWAPTFDHAVKDPRPMDAAITADTRIVLIEGNYVALDEPLWRDARQLFDEVWFVDVDFEVARKRLRTRHVEAGIAKTEEEGDRRALENDLPNGQEIIDKRLPVDEIVKSR